MDAQTDFQLMEARAREALTRSGRELARAQRLIRKAKRFLRSAGGGK